MPRIRTVKPEHWNDKELAKISLQAHLLWLATWNFSDDEGVFENDPILLKSQIFPRRIDVRIEQIATWLDQLVKARFIIPFEYNEESYFLQRTFKAHQKVDRPQPSKIPDDVIRRVFVEHSSNVRPCIVEESNSSVKDSGAAAKKESSVDFPFGGDFKKMWDQWKKYKKDEHRFNYKSIQSEQAALHELIDLSTGDEETAIAIIKQSLAKGWKGLFNLKKDNNANSNNSNNTGYRPNKHEAGINGAFDDLKEYLNSGGIPGM